MGRKKVEAELTQQLVKVTLNGGRRWPVGRSEYVVVAQDDYGRMEFFGDPGVLERVRRDVCVRCDLGELDDESERVGTEGRMERYGCEPRHRGEVRRCRLAG